MLTICYLKISVSLPLFIIYIYIVKNVSASLGIYSNLLKISSPNLFDNTISTLTAYVSKKTTLSIVRTNSFYMKNHLRIVNFIIHNQYI